MELRADVSESVPSEYGHVGFWIRGRFSGWTVHLLIHLILTLNSWTADVMLRLGRGSLEEYEGLLTFSTEPIQIRAR